MKYTCPFLCFYYHRRMDIEDIIKAFNALGQETRLKILNLLVGAGSRGLSAGDISLALGVPQNTLSFHLSHLENAALLHRRRAGRFIIYSVNNKGMKDLLLYMIENCCDKTASN
ncbi:MAG: transcriptional regulator [Alphaproteobacteria bacterium CG_4_9_14_3_um_filter_47_13]|nr:MAG: transcriptional regulator [Alphaproteobacteria bacterium CG_4_9_14_3_um_filter_47_13]